MKARFALAAAAFFASAFYNELPLRADGPAFGAHGGYAYSYGAYASAPLTYAPEGRRLPPPISPPVLDGPEATRHDLHARWNARRFAWHAPYANTTWGWPVALVIPPTAHMHTNYGWGVGATQMVPNYHQFGPSAGNPAGLMGPPGFFGGPLLPTPYWPSHTDQFGVYYVRAPY